MWAASPMAVLSARPASGLLASACLWRQVATIVANSGAEKAIAEKLKAGLANATEIKVQDTSGGCGSMYSLDVAAAEFKGKSKLKQHQLVHKLIADDVKQWHGFTLNTREP